MATRNSKKTVKSSASSQETVGRLAKNFHLTFIPERIHLGGMLKYAANSGVYDMNAIAEETGIPTGKSSGKAIPTANYAIGMGLVAMQPVGEKKDRKFVLTLTDLGRAVYLGDHFLQEELTQWLAHFYLCNKNTGADFWYQFFWNASSAFGGKFIYGDLIDWIKAETGAKDAEKAITPAIRMYSDLSSFATCGAVMVEHGIATRKPAPLNPSYAIGYAAWLSDLMEKSGLVTGHQTTVDDLENICGFRAVTSWSLKDSQDALSMMEDKGLVAVDRHMQPWIVTFKFASSQLWTRLYEEFI